MTRHRSLSPILYSLTVASFTWIAFVAQAAIVGHATSLSGDVSTEQGVAVFWGQSPRLVLAAAVVHIGWGYEAVRWRVALLK